MRIKRQQSGAYQAWLSESDTYWWSRKPGAVWPCSTLANHRLWVSIAANGDLEDITIDGKSNVDCDVNELNAILADMVPPPTYRIVRFFQRSGTRRTIKAGLSLEAAQAHCRNPETSCYTCKGSKAKRRTYANGPWSDGYELET